MQPLLPPQVEQVVVGQGAASDRVVVGDGATLSLILVGENDGFVGGCGCDQSPRGGLARVATLVDARRKAEPEVPALLLHAGNWLSVSGSMGKLDPRTIERNLAVHRALGELRFDALAATWRDLPGIPDGPHPGMVSATFRSPGLTVLRQKEIDAGGVPLVVTSVSREGPPWLLPEGTEPLEPLAALATVERRPEDLVVVFAYGLADRVEELAALPDVDLVVDTAEWTGFWEPRVVGNAVVVRTRAQALTADELRLWVDAGRITRLVDRVIPLDAALAEDRQVARHALD
ncbi:MAG: hypothetical protein KC621_17980 [Myxococcales bacterium]|nr:hypothetical protein [Myxococcales bacterium]